MDFYIAPKWMISTGFVQTPALVERKSRKKIGAQKRISYNGTPITLVFEDKSEKFFSCVHDFVKWLGRPNATNLQHLIDVFSTEDTPRKVLTKIAWARKIREIKIEGHKDIFLSEPVYK